MDEASPVLKRVWAVLVAVAAVTGFSGWLLQGAGPANAVYQTMQLFLLEFPDDLELHPVLEVGRFTAAAATGLALVAIGVSFVGGRVNRWRIKRLRDHTIVIGSGHTGATILENLQPEDTGRLVAIDLSQDALEQVARLGVRVLRGDGRTARLLEAAGAAKAARVIVAVEDWGPATEIVKVAADVAPGARILAHLDDLTLLQALRLRVLADPNQPGEVFNLHENAARELLRGFDDRLAGSDRGPTRIIIIGGDQVAEAVIVRATYAWLASLRGFPLQIHFVGARAAALLGEVIARWPELADQLAGCIADATSPMSFAVCGDLRSDDLVIVDLDDSDHAVAVGATIREEHPAVEVVVIGRARAKETAVHGFETCDLSSLAWTPRILDADSQWQLAYSMHENYRQGVLAATSPHGVPWDDLPTHIQEDNRAAVVHMLHELPRHGYRLTRATRELLARPVEELTTLIDQDVLAQLARSEHDRWVADRRRSPAAPQRHDQPWDELGKDAREGTLATVASWSRLLLRLGYQLDTVMGEERVGRLLDGAATYHRIGADVRAERVETTTTWMTGNGDQLKAEVGDWMIEGAHGSRWSISDEALRLTYRQVGDGRYRPVGTVQAVELTAPARVRSPEGDVVGRPGDWLVRNALGHVWIVDAATFSQRYRPAPVESTAPVEDSS